MSQFPGVPVLITGETGTGKELVADALHYLSNRCQKPLRKINCSAIPETLLESQLFGHRKGAFTGATMAQKGLVELAHDGTLLLDEISQMKPELQPKLLRFLEDGSFLPVGETEERWSDVWIIAATNQNLKELIEKNLFWADLYYRLNVVEIKLPPLRERREDILPLTRYFLEEFSHEFGVKPKKLSPEVQDMLLQYPWPGNVRELRNVMRGAMVRAEGEVIEAKNIPAEIGKGLDTGGKVGGLTLAEAERAHIVKIFQENGKRIRKTALLLGIDRNTLKKRLRNYGFNTDSCEVGEFLTH